MVLIDKTLVEADFYLPSANCRGAITTFIESCEELLRKADFAFPSNAAHPSTVLITPTTSTQPDKRITKI